MAEAPTPLHSGKVRDIYGIPGQPKRLLVITSDRISIFDVIMKEKIPGRGKVLTAMTNFWLRDSGMEELRPNHLEPFSVAELPAWAHALHDRAMVVRAADMQPVEWIVRSHLAGSAWREYRDHGTMHGTRLPADMLECDELPEPVVTPSTKGELGTHDQNITFQEAANLVGAGEAAKARDMCLAAYRRVGTYAHERGVVLLDTKFELGYVDGVLTFCDEVFTPDSSRFILAEDHRPGHPPAARDKEYLRQWGRSINWTGQEPPPALPGYVIRQAVQHYSVICRQLTGETPL